MSLTYSLNGGSEESYNPSVGIVIRENSEISNIKVGGETLLDNNGDALSYEYKVKLNLPNCVVVYDSNKENYQVHINYSDIGLDGNPLSFGDSDNRRKLMPDNPVGTVYGHGYYPFPVSGTDSSFTVGSATGTSSRTMKIWAEKDGYERNEGEITIEGKSQLPNS